MGVPEESSSPTYEELTRWTTMGYQWMERHFGSEEVLLRLAVFSDRIYGMDSASVMSGIEPNEDIRFFLRSYLDYPDAYRFYGARLIAAFMGYLEDMEV